MPTINCDLVGQKLPTFFPKGTREEVTILHAINCDSDFTFLDGHRHGIAYANHRLLGPIAILVTFQAEKNSEVLAVAAPMPLRPEKVKELRKLFGTDVFGYLSAFLVKHSLSLNNFLAYLRRWAPCHNVQGSD